MSRMSSVVSAVCVVHEVIDDAGDVGRTAIDKRVVTGPVRVTRGGVAGDSSCDVAHHGGPYQAVYAYADEDADWWAGELDRPVPPGRFGENLRTRGIDLQRTVIGERWQLGEGPDAVVVEVTKPRVPCATFQRWMDEPRWVRRFTEGGRPGAYLRVVREGTVAAGAPLRVLDVPAHGVTLLQAFRTDDPPAMGRLLASADDGSLDLDLGLRKRATLAAGRG